MSRGYSILDAGEILDDFILICRVEGDVFIGDVLESEHRRFVYALAISSIIL
jgi:hypothetical protein